MTNRLQERLLDPVKPEADALRELAQRVSATVGGEFFHAITRHLAKALHADTVAISEFVSGPVERVASVAAVTHGQRDHFDQELAGSAASLVRSGRSCVCRSGARRKLPGDTVLARLRAESFVGVPLLDEHGKPIGILLAVYRRPVPDLDEPKALLKIFASRASAELVRKQEEERLREREQRYRVFVMRNPIAMWRIEFRQPIPIALPEEQQIEMILEYGYLAECNEALASLMEAESTEALIGRRVREFLPQFGESAQEATLHLIRSAYQLTTSEVDLVTQSGKRRNHVRTAWGILENDRLVRIWGTTQDVTDLQQSQLALEAAESRIAHMLEVAQVAVVILELDGAISYANRYLTTLTGWECEDLIGKNWVDALIPAEERDKVRTTMNAGAAQAPDQVHLESTVAGRDGGRWWIAWDTALLRNPRGEVEGAVLIGRDITEQRAMEEQFRQAQKLEGIGRLAGGIAHDFNNLLTVIGGYSALLLQQKALPDAVLSAVEQVRKAAEKGAQLTNQLLAFSRRQVLRPQVLELNSIVEDAETMLRRLVGDDVELITALDPAAGCVRADPGHIHQVLMNLVLNARDAMPQGGAITIQSENRIVNGPHELSAPGVPPGEFVMLSVNDTGTGMTEEVRSQMFEPFFTTKERGKGTGMGLPVVYGIVRQSGGYIVVDSKPAAGTRFQIFLPRVELIEAACEDAEGGQELQGGSEVILVVEDSQEVRTLAATTLRNLGYAVLEAENAANAIELAEHRPDIQLLVADMMMPGMSGSSLAQLLLRSRPQLKILLMSGHTDIPVVAGLVGESGLPFLRKPFTPAALAGKIREILDRKKGPGGHEPQPDTGPIRGKGSPP
jgi:two-component system cell cycle sensor histidine kinase/response regulator CckA